MNNNLGNQLINKLTTKNIDMKGRRVINSSKSRALTDGVIKSELDDAVDTLTRLISLLNIKIPMIAISDQVLTAASTEIKPPKSGNIWIAIIRQDGTGGRAITWSSRVSGASASINTTASTLSTFILAYSQHYNKWVMVGQPTTGMTP